MSIHIVYLETENRVNFVIRRIEYSGHEVAGGEERESIAVVCILLEVLRTWESVALQVELHCELVQVS